MGDVGLDSGDAVPADGGEPGDRPAEGGAVAVEGGDGGPFGQAAGGDGQADARGGTGDEHPYGGQEASVGWAAIIVRNALRLCVHKGRLSRTDRLNRYRGDGRSVPMAPHNRRSQRHNNRVAIALRSVRGKNQALY